MIIIIIIIITIIIIIIIIIMPACICNANLTVNKNVSSVLYFFKIINKPNILKRSFYFRHTYKHKTVHITALVTPVVEHWLKRGIGIDAMTHLMTNEHQFLRTGKKMRRSKKEGRNKCFI